MPGTEGHIIPSIRWSTGDKEIRRSPNSRLTALRAVRQQVNHKCKRPVLSTGRLHFGILLLPRCRPEAGVNGLFGDLLIS